MDVSPELLTLFSAEADEILGRMEQGLVQLEGQPEDQGLLETVFRGAHTLKGNSASLGLDGAAAYCHELEEVLDRLREGQISTTPTLITLLLRAVDVLRDLLSEETSTGAGLAERHRDLLRQLDEESSATARPRTRRGGKTGSRVPPSPPVRSAETDESGQGRRVKPSGPRTLRVDMHTLDALLSLAGEIAISRDRLTGVLERADANPAEALEMHRDADRLHAELQEAVIRARMVPLGPTFRQHIRTVRDLSASRGKSARLLVEGEDVAVDATVVDYLREPLVHMIRNAFDHGIEGPEARAAAGKEATGTITLRARRESGQIVVEVSDDGAGLDRDAVLRRARERGLVADGQQLSGAEIDQLVFAPGLSTSAAVTDLSGRGVGLDVVRRSVEAVRGSIEIEAQRGRGTTLRLWLPLTLAIIDGFHVVVGGRGYVVPTEAVVECQEAPAPTSLPPRAGLTVCAGRALPYLRLARLFGVSASLPGRQSLVVVKNGSAQVGLLVDEILGSLPTVVRPLGALLRGVPGVSGSTIRRNGEVALILDVASLLQQAPIGAHEVAP